MSNLPNSPRELPVPFSIEKLAYLPFGEPAEPILEAELVSREIPPAYGVPPRFGMLALLALMAAFSVTFGFLRFINAPAAVYLFLATMAVVIGVTQMRFGAVPRGASIVAGGLFLPLFWLGTLVVMARIEGHSMAAIEIFGFIGATPLIAVGGAICGYLMGTLVAGVFLLANMWEQRITTRATGATARE